MHSTRRAIVAALTALALLALGSAAHAQIQVPTTHEGYLAAKIGKFDAINGSNPAAEFGVEYRPGLSLWIFQPMVGVMHTTNGATNAFAGISTEVVFWDRFIVRPTAALSGYARGAGKNLGDGFEFRESLEFAYRFDDRSRLGVEIYHLSNAWLGSRNPGEESITAIYSLPTARIAGWFGN